jgi:branched-chain amino acid transport system substrate-binding protein
MAAAKINADGGVNGKQIKIVTFDDRDDTTEAANVAQKIGSDSSIVASMGHFTSSTVYAAMPIYKTSQMPLLVISASDPKITQQNNEWVFRVSPPNDVGVRAQVDLIVKQLGIKKVATMYLNTDFGKSEHGAFLDQVKKDGGTVVFDEPYQPDTKDFTSSLIKLKGSGAEATYLSSYYNDAALLIKQAKNAGVETRWFASGGITSPEFSQVGGPAVEGVITARTGGGSSWDQVAAEYKQQNGQDASPFVIYAYSATQAIAAAAKQKGTSRKDIRDGLAQFKNFDAAIGPLTFDANRQVEYNNVTFLIVKDGQFQVWKP